MKMSPFFQKKHWGVLFAQVFSLVLVISLALPTFAANAQIPGPEGSWQQINLPITLELFDGSDNGNMYCNFYAGSYSTLKGGDNCGAPLPISFSTQASTKVGCAENPSESGYLQSLEGTEAYRVCDDMLTLYGPDTLQFARR